MTQDQEINLRSFAEERDKLIAELVPLRNEKESLLKDLSESSQSMSEIDKLIDFKKGQFSILEDAEEERSLLISQDLAFKIVEKIQMENTLTSLKKEVDELDLKKKDIELSLSNLVPVYERVTWQINQLTETVHKVVTVNSDNIKELNILISELNKVLINKQN